AQTGLLQHVRGAHVLLADHQACLVRRGDRDRPLRRPDREARAVPRRASPAGAPAPAPPRRRRSRRQTTKLGGYSHSIVAGGFDVTSRTTRFTPAISFTIRPEIVSIKSYGSRAQSAVMASSEMTARITIG